MNTETNTFVDVLNHLDDGVYMVDPQRHITFWNKTAEELTGYSAEEVLGRSCADGCLVHVDKDGRTLCSNGCPMLKSITTGEICLAQVFLHHKEGHRVPVTVRTLPLRDNFSRILGAVQVFRDESETQGFRIRLKELQKLARVDHLTGIACRRHAENILEGRLSELANHSLPFGLIMIDIDNFKSINDSYGHQAGDRVLKMVAKSLSHNCRMNDLTARWGGDEFAVITGHITEEELKATCDRLRNVIRSSFLHIGTAVVRTTVSIGAAIAAGEITREQLVQQVDELLYESKQAGRDYVSIAA